MNQGIILHGGAGPLEENKDELDEKKEFMKDLATSAKNLLDEDKKAVDVVEWAICMMEDSGKFNAGKGSCLTINKTIEMDAGIMSGKDLACGAVALVKNFSNPIKIARKVMEQSNHSLIAGNGIESFAEKHHMQRFKMSPTTKSLEKFTELLKTNHSNLGQDTVGSIVITKNGDVAAGVSTGGLWLKSEGRIGDSAIVGSGFYADNRHGAAVATGNGDIIMKSGLSKNVCDLMAVGVQIQQACKIAIQSLSKMGGNGGVIAVDNLGNFSFHFNSQTMPCSWFFNTMEKPSVN